MYENQDLKQSETIATLDPVSNKRPMQAEYRQDKYPFPNFPQVSAGDQAGVKHAL